MSVRGICRSVVVASAFWVVLTSGSARSELVRVRHREGLLHGFLILKSSKGQRIATGELIQDADGDRVTSRLLFRFDDGSMHDETTVFSQRGRFRLVRDHLVQIGPSFPRALDLTVDGTTGRVTARYSDEGGEQKTDTEQLRPVPELANGLVPTLLKNVTGKSLEGLSIVVATPKPRIVRLAVAAAGEDAFSAAGVRHRSTHFVVKAELGGITGAVAKLLGKSPPDSHVWVLGGDAPAFVAAEQPFFAGGPLWRIELVSPRWEREGDGLVGAR